jgi:ABC-type transporter MlaC component
LKHVKSIGAALVCTLSALALIAPFSARAAGSPGPGEMVVRRTIESLRKLRTVADGTERKAIIRSLDDTLALDTLARDALAAEWGRLGTAERRHFIALLRQPLEKLAYPRAAEFFSDIEVAYKGEDIRGGMRVVKSIVTRKEGGAIAINYVLAAERASLHIADIELDGQSLKHQVASQMQAVLRQGSYRSLVAQMEARLKQPDS